MAKTPLLHSLQRLAVDYRLARGHGLSLHAIRELRAEARRRAQEDPERSGTVLSRREFLGAAGAVLTTVALPRHTRATSAPRIAIVGGGIAGLTCALHLADEGTARHLDLETVVQRSMRLVRLQQTAGGRYRLWFECHGSTREGLADYVLLALPFAVLREIDTRQAGFDALKQQAIQTLGRGHNSKLQLQCTTRHWNQTGPWPGVSNGTTFVDTGYQASWDVTRAQAGSSGILNFYSGGSVTDAMVTQQAFAQGFKPGVLEDAKRALAQVEPVFPGLSAVWNQRVTQSLPHKSRFFRPRMPTTAWGSTPALPAMSASDRGAYFSAVNIPR